MKYENRSPVGLYTVCIAALFLAGFLLLVVFGAQSFRNAVAGQNENMETRAILSYLATSVKVNDSASAISVQETEYGPALIVADGSTGYALRMYCYDGYLMEDFARREAALAPEEAEVIGRTTTFTIEELEEGVLAVYTDEGRVLLRVRSGEGGIVE